MSIEREHSGGFVAECDSCSHTELLDAEHFDTAVKELEDLDWVKYQDRKGCWLNDCPSCEKEKQAEQLKKDFG